ncbi:MAG TPA: hotdog domain-containing protein [Thermoanaerobaculia bacterium]|jgi:acyl-CoA thioesterase YciA
MRAASAPPPAELSPDEARRDLLAIRVVLLPKDTNALGTIFGGVILSYIDQAGAVEAHRHTAGRIVTVAMREVVFHAPVLVGDLVSFYTRTERLGTTSITVAVEVEAERGHPGGQRVKVTEAEVVFVHVDGEGHPTPLGRGRSADEDHARHGS